MANRVTVEEVQEIFNTTLKYDQISACITAANLLTTNVPAASTNPSLDAATLKEIERWLAAHFCCINDPVALRVKIGDSESWNFPASVTTAWGQGLRLTVYGQNAIALDITGELSKLGLMKGSFRAAPRENSSRFTRNLTTS